jgi:hypothetical protein
METVATINRAGYFEGVAGKRKSHPKVAFRDCPSSESRGIRWMHRHYSLQAAGFPA